ncbi:hypothetical protein D3C73_1196610 [compost metagenome]
MYQILDLGNADQKFKDHHKDSGEPDAAFKQEVENIIDTLVGNLKNAVTMKEEGSNKEIHFQLSGSQISPVVNTIGSLLIRQDGHSQDKLDLKPSDTFGVDVATIHDSMPKLKEDIKIASVRLDAAVDADNRITNQSAVIEISGKDQAGAQHEVSVKLNIGLSDFGQTTPNTVDLTGKKVETVKPEFGKEHRRNGN